MTLKYQKEKEILPEDLSSWELVDSGGAATFLGMGSAIDDNAKAKFLNSNGEYVTYRMDALYKLLKANGYTEDDAEKYVLALQDMVGI